MSKKVQFDKFVDRLDVVKIICKRTYCTKSEKGELSACHKECRKQNLGDSNTEEYKKCQTICNLAEHNRKEECVEKCDAKRDIIQEETNKYKDCMLNNEEVQKHKEKIISEAKLQYEQALLQEKNKYEQEVRNAVSRAEEEYKQNFKVDANDIKEALLNKAKEIMEKSNYKSSAEPVKDIVTMEENYVSDTDYYDTEFFAY